MAETEREALIEGDPPASLTALAKLVKPRPAPAPGASADARPTDSVSSRQAEPFMKS
jgi:hypothetical protein